MRRITTGIQGGPILGTFTAEENNLKTIENNTDIILDANGSGIARVNSHLQLNSQGELRLGDADNAQYIGMVAPNDVTSYTLTLPSAAPSANGYALLVNSNGSTTFGDLSLETNNNTTSTGAFYVALMDDADADDGSVNSLSYSDNKIEFTPSSGTLTVTNISTGNIGSSGTATLATVDCNGGNIDGTTIGSATAAAGTFTSMTASSITETSSIVYKENINPIQNALDKILQLDGVTYDRKDGSSVMEAGLIKEEVEKILPNVTQGDGIQYTKLTAYLIEAVKSLTKEINELKKQG
jgi:hypothetical protein